MAARIHRLSVAGSLRQVQTITQAFQQSFFENSQGTGLISTLVQTLQRGVVCRKELRVRVVFVDKAQQKFVQVKAGKQNRPG